MKRLLLSIILILSVTHISNADTVTASTVVEMGSIYDGALQYWKSFIKIAIPSELTGATITGATLKLTPYSVPTGINIGAYCPTAAWDWGSDSVGTLNGLSLGSQLDATVVNTTTQYTWEDLSTGLTAQISAGRTYFTVILKDEIHGTVTPSSKVTNILIIGDADTEDGVAYLYSGGSGASPVIDITYTTGSTPRIPRQSGTVGVLLIRDQTHSRPFGQSVDVALPFGQYGLDARRILTVGNSISTSNIDRFLLCGFVSLPRSKPLDSGLLLEVLPVPANSLVCGVADPTETNNRYDAVSKPLNHSKYPFYLMYSTTSLQ
jgi:hypothetical protein